MNHISWKYFSQEIKTSTLTCAKSSEVMKNEFPLVISISFFIIDFEFKLKYIYGSEKKEMNLIFSKKLTEKNCSIDGSR